MKNSNFDVTNATEQRQLNDYEIVDHLEAAIEKDPYRLYIGRNVFVFTGIVRLELLKDILKKAQKNEDIEFCKRIKSVYHRLQEKYKSDGKI